MCGHYTLECVPVRALGLVVADPGGLVKGNPPSGEIERSVLERTVVAASEMIRSIVVVDILARILLRRCRVVFVVLEGMVAGSAFVESDHLRWRYSQRAREVRRVWEG